MVSQLPSTEKKQIIVIFEYDNNQLSRLPIVK